MSHDRGIITVVGQNEEQDDEDLAALRQLPRFEPLVVPEATTQFSLASVFGSLSASRYSDVGEQAFNPNTLVDILVQVNTHSKRCAQDIQEYQRLLAVKMKSLDEYTASAVQELGSIHQRAKVNSDQLLSVHALEKQARITTTFLHGIVEKLAIIGDHLPPEELGQNDASLESYPNLQRYLQQIPQQSLFSGNRSSNSKSTTASTGVTRPESTYNQKPSGLALLGHNSQYQHHSLQRSNNNTNSKYQGSPLLYGTSASSSSSSSSTPTTARASALSIPKARASMALTSTSLDFLPSHATTALAHGTMTSRQEDTTPTLRGMNGTSSNSSNGNNGGGKDYWQGFPQSTTTGNLTQETRSGHQPLNRIAGGGAGTGTGEGSLVTGTTTRTGSSIATTSQQTSSHPPRASDNLRKLASKSPVVPSSSGTSDQII